MGTVGYLLDTHTFLWAVCDSRRLGAGAKKVIADAGAPLFLSPASAYEIMNKHRIGKLPGYEYVADNYLDILRDFGAEELPISARQAYFAGKFEWTHRDPFDRFLVAQAYMENLTLLSQTSQQLLRE